jgi:thiamine-phosphate pyrophosphorylase
LLLVGADARLATRLGADGVHVPERLAGRTGEVRALRRRFLVTAAAHGIPGIMRARRSGVDAVVISPVFASASASARRSLGPRLFAVLVRNARLPAYALGGVNGKTARQLSGSGAVGLAAVEAISVAVPPVRI